MTDPTLPPKPPRHGPDLFEPKKRFASVEECEAIPIFSTPTNMYFSSELNPRPRFSAPKSFLYQNNIPPNTPPKDKSSQKEQSPSKSTTQSPHKDGLLAQLLDMGFDIHESRIALAASPETVDLQTLLDLILQNKHIPESSDEDEETERRKEEIWRKEKEERRKAYLESERRREQERRQREYKETERRKAEDLGKSETQQERKQGNLYFNRGQFVEAEKCYSKAIACLSLNNHNLVLLYNNRAATRLKLGRFDDCLPDCTRAIDLASQNTFNQAELTEGVSSWTSQWLKALHRKACALEGLKRFDQAVDVYEEYARLEGTRSSVVVQGILRCQHKQSGPGPSWTPANDSTAFPDIDFNMFVSNPNSEEINASKAVREMREREKKREAEDAERLEKTDAVNAQLMTWKTGKERNLRALLSSLDRILWSSIQWSNVSMTDLLEPRKCKLTYMKAIAKVHPDKLPSNASVEQRLLASGVFTTLNQAWDAFRTENNL